MKGKIRHSSHPDRESSGLRDSKNNQGGVSLIKFFKVEGEIR
jgi:hypothetical protein